MSELFTIDELERWASNDAGIMPDHFACPFYESCNESIRHELRGGEGCCMSYIGPQYGAGFRLALVGIDHGRFSFASYEERQKEIQDEYLNKRIKFDQHYKGVVRTAAAILGKSGSYCQANCLNSCCVTRDEGCVINRIAQPNLVKCVPCMQSGSASRSTVRMKSNCAQHLLAELRILRPHMILFHGINNCQIVRRVFEDAGISLVDITEWSDGNGPETLCHSAVLGAHLLFLYHPSHNWLNERWHRIQKCIGYLREHAFIPE